MAPTSEQARRNILRRFPTPESRTAHFSTLGKQAGESRVILPAEDVRALRDAYAILTRIAQRHPKIANPLEPPPPQAPATPRDSDVIARAQLTRREQQVWTLRTLEGLSLRDTADALRLSHERVRQIEKDVRRKIATVTADDGT